MATSQRTRRLRAALAVDPRKGWRRRSRHQHPEVWTQLDEARAAVRTKRKAPVRHEE